MRKILIIFVGWQLMIAVFIAIGQRIIPATTNCVYTENFSSTVSRFLWNRANFDGMHYISISRNGYGPFQQAFFRFTRLIRWLNPLFGGLHLITGLAISWLSFFLSLIFFYKLLLLDYKQKIVNRTIFYLLIFPTAFFFSAVYTESLFFFLVIAAFYFARTKQWWLAGILGLLASGTRLVGVFLFPALLYELYYQLKVSKSVNSLALKIQDNFYVLIREFSKLAIPIFLIPLGLLFYMLWLGVNYHDPLMFIHAQSDKIILLYQVCYRYLKMVATTRINPLYFTVWLELSTGLLFLFLTFWGIYKKTIRLSYLIFMVLAYLAPTTTGTFVSLPRFALLFFPGFIVLAHIESKYFRLIYPIISLILLLLAVSFFVQGYFVS